MNNRKKNKDLPVHFFTIVLNGKPFIEYHVNVFKQLPFKWHWHVVEGVADLKNDTAWSLKNGAFISDELHNNGLSNDGTSEYLDELKKQFPDNVTVYRKENGQFWNGKLEMVNAPIPNINEECILWEIDSDELWTADQFVLGRQLYINNPNKTASFYFCFFFVGEKLFITSTDTYGNHTKFEWLRSWRFLPGDQWVTHEPPRLCRKNENGEWIDISLIDPIKHDATQHHGLVFQHFAYVTPEQLKFKEKYYGYKNALEQWKELQTQKQFPVMLKDYFEWVKDGAAIDSIDKFGIKPIAQKDNDRWAFNYKSIEQKEIKKILFVRTDAVGDCILSASLLEPIKNKFKDAEITVVSQKHTSEIFKNSPFVNEVIEVDKPLFKKDQNYRNNFLNNLTNLNFDLAVNPVYSREDVTDFLALMSGSKETAAFAGDTSNIPAELLAKNNQFYTTLVNADTKKKNELQLYKEFLEVFNINVDSLKPYIQVNEESEIFADKFFENNFNEDERIIALFPFAKHYHKEYKNYGAVLNAFPDYKFILLGGEEKIEQARYFQQFNNCINLVGKTDIIQLASVIKRCSLYVGADSSGAHIACALNIPNVVILGGGHFGRFLPYSKYTSVVCKPIKCYSCNWNCIHDKVQCVEEVSPYLIEFAIKEILNGISEKAKVFYTNQNGDELKIIKEYLSEDSFEFIEESTKVNSSGIEDAIESGDYTTAVKLLQDIIEKEPGNLEALNNLAVVLSLLGDNESALRALNIVFKVDPDNKIAKENLEIFTSGISNKNFEVGAKGKELFEKYINTFDGIEGWFDKRAVKVLQFFNSLQVAENIEGNIFEIGAYKGKLTILLSIFLRENERLVVNDIFDLQNLNISRSGTKANFTDFLNNLAQFFNDLSFLEIIVTGSSNLHKTERKEKFRIFSVDGGHSAHETYEDMLYADSVIDEKGIVILDDYYNSNWPGVKEGADKFIQENDGLVPFAAFFNKFIYVKKQSIDYFINKLNEYNFAGFCGEEGYEIEEDVLLSNKFIKIKKSKKVLSA